MWELYEGHYYCMVPVEVLVPRNNGDHHNEHAHPIGAVSHLSVGGVDYRAVDPHPQGEAHATLT